jgi:hypothetical protein
VYRVQAHPQAPKTLDAAPTATAPAVAAGGAGKVTDASSSTSRRVGVRELSGHDDVTLTNGVLEVTVGAAVGIKRVKVLSSGQTHSYSSSLVAYEAEKLFQQPGAYIFATHQESEVSSVLLLLLC